MVQHLFPDAFLDYQTYLDPSFDAVSYSNAVVLATNFPGDPEVDLETPLSKVRFDLAEVDKMITHELESHYQIILQHAKQVRREEERISEIESAVSDMGLAYERIAQKTLEPFNQAAPLLDALSNLSSLIPLVRSLVRYLNLAGRLSTQIQDLPSSRLDDGDHHQTFIRLATTIAELDRLLLLDPQLSLLPAVSAHSSVLSSTRNTLQTRCTYLLRSDQQAAALSAATALNWLSPSALGRAVKQTLLTLVDAGISALQKSLDPPSVRTRQLAMDARAQTQLWIGITRAFGEIGRLGLKATQLNDVVTELKLLDSIESTDSLDGSRPSQWFWREMASKVEQRLRDICKSNAPLSRTLKSSFPRLQSIIRDSIKAKDGSPEMVIMLRSVKSIET